MEQINLKGKVILITGAGQGIGRALALGAAAAGATTIILGKTLKKLESLYDEMMEKGYPEPAIHPLNLLKMEPQHAHELADSIGKLFGRLDAVVHNAGISGPITPLEHLSPAKWQEVMHLNVNAPYLLTHALLPLLKNTPYSSILFTTANEAMQPKAYWSAYSASKHAVLALAQSLDQELEANTTIRVNSINPGMIRTGMRSWAYPGIDPQTWAEPSEIIPQYLHLLSDDAKFTRGQHIQVKTQAREVIAKEIAP